MEGLVFLAVIFLFSIPVLWIIVLSRRGGGDLRPRLDALEQRVAALRVTIDRLAASAPAPPAAPVPEQAADTAAPPLPAAPPEVTASPPPHPTMPPEAAAPAPSRPSVSAPTAAVPRPPREGWEQQIMRRWAVWLGALALALGGVFLVKYSIEQGFFGPAARVVAGSLLGLALVAASEWTRRRPLPAATLGGLSPDYVPPALAAAGTVVLFASVYGGYALYDLLAPAPAFVLLAIVALGGAALSLLHGVLLAWLGLAGAYVVPLLVSAHEPSVPRLLAYVLAVSGGCLWLVRWRDWPWLGWAAVAGSGFWGVIALSLAGAANTQWIGTYLALLALLFLAAAGEEGVHRRHGAVVWSGLAMLALLMLALGLQAEFDATSLAFAWVLTALYAAAGVRWARFDRLPWIAALLQVLVLAFWIFKAGAGGREHLGVIVTLPPNTPLGAYLETAALVAALAGLGGFAMLGRAPRPDRWALLSATTPLAVLAAVYWRVEQFEQSLSWATAAFLLAATFLAAVEYLMPRRAKPGFTNALAYYALAVTAALALGLTLSLRLGWLSVALSLQLPAMAWLHERTGVRALRSAAAVLGVIVLARLLLNPAVADYDFGARPIVNGLLYTYGIPAACFALTARRLRRSADDGAVQLLEAGALALGAALVSLEIRHLLGGGRIDSPSYTLLEMALQTDAWLAMAYVLLPRGEGPERPVRAVAWRLMAGAAAAHLLLRQCLTANPLLANEDVGALPVLDVLLLAYAVPAGFGVLYYRTLRSRFPELANAAGIAALALAFIYISLEVRHLFHGARLVGGGVSDGEWYAYSAAWLVYGAALLAVGIVRRHSPLRSAGLVVGALVAVKAFGFDMAALTGLYRAASFLGLGVSLMAIARLYQHMIMPSPDQPRD